MTNIKTHPKLLDILAEGAQRGPTASEIANQRVSFIIGSLKEGSTVTRDKVREILAEQEGRKAS